MIALIRSKSLTDVHLAGQLLRGLENHYPDFGHWFTNKCMPGIVAGEDTMILATEKHRIIGVALGKKGVSETKLRCVRVTTEHQGSGVGLRLIDRMLRELDCDKPHCTVSEEMLHLYSRAFVNHYDFDLSAVEKGMYRPGKLEYVFNGPVDRTSSVFESSPL